VTTVKNGIKKYCSSIHFKSGLVIPLNALLEKAQIDFSGQTILKKILVKYFVTAKIFVS